MAALKRTLRRGARLLDRCLSEADRISGGRVALRSRDIARAVSLPGGLNKGLRQLRPDIIHVSERSELHRVWVEGTERVEKRYETDEKSQAALNAEREAHALFGALPWKLPLLSLSEHGYTMPKLPRSARLDYQSAHLDAEARRRCAVDALSIALELYRRGVAHRDFHCGNLYLHEGRLLLSDFETCTTYEGEPPPFERSYDLTGEGASSPLDTGRMCYQSTMERSLERQLGVSLEEALEGLRERLSAELIQACGSFMRTRQTFGQREGRHQAEYARAYSSIELPSFLIEPSGAQRNTTRRFERYRAGDAAFKHKRVLDLGCNAGAMSFGAVHRGASEVLGVEYDQRKVEIASRIAHFAGAKEARFVQGDVDQLDVQAVDGPFEVVFCFAIEGHVNQPHRLYKLLGELTTETLYFEGNAGCDIESVERRLRRAGFREVEQLGLSDDEQEEANNQRPMLIARR